jgi:hypothetical protein
MEKVRGCSGNVFRVSKRIFAGIAILPLAFASTGKCVVIVVSRSDAEI